MIRFYVIAVLFGVFVAISAWLRVVRERDPVVLAHLKQRLPRFVTFLIAGTMVLLAIIWVLESHNVPESFWSIPFVLLSLALGVLVRLGVRPLERENRERINRQLWKLLLVLSLPVVLYAALIQGSDPVVIAGLAFFGNIAAFLFLRFNSWKQDK